MEKRYISENRYKKTSATSSRRRRSSNIKEKIKEQNKKKIAPKVVSEKSTQNRQKSVNKKKTSITKANNKGLNIIICIILLAVVGILSRAILKEEGEPFIPIFNPKVDQNSDEIKLAVITEENISGLNTKNVIANELNLYSYDTLIMIGTDYSIKYKLAKSIDKVSNKDYQLILDEKYNIDSTMVKTSIESHMNKDSVFYTKTKNISKIEIIDKYKLNIVLKQEDPYYIYNLELPINSSKLSSYTKTDMAKSVVYERKEEANKTIPYKFTISKFKDIYDVAGAYKKQEISAFFTSQDVYRNILGKYEYNVKTFRSGESIFLFGNKSSETFNRKEVRQAIAYSINRDEIIKKICVGYSVSKIDLPYIYDNVKYKYDIYAAENILLSSGYTKASGIYKKTENGKSLTLELSLIVNKEDETKVKIAEEIKANVAKIGIGIEIEKLSLSQINKRLDNGNYDLVLASINLNNNPSIDFINNYLNLTDNINEKIDKVKKSKAEELVKNIEDLRGALSEDVACIGIYSNNTYMILDKNIIGFEDIKYMNIFSKILSAD